MNFIKTKYNSYYAEVSALEIEIVILENLFVKVFNKSKFKPILSAGLFTDIESAKEFCNQLKVSDFICTIS